MKKRTTGHTETAISGDTRDDWSEAFALVPNLEIVFWINFALQPPVDFSEILWEREIPQIYVSGGCRRHSL